MTKNTLIILPALFDSAGAGCQNPAILLEDIAALPDQPIVLTWKPQAAALFTIASPRSGIIEVGPQGVSGVVNAGQPKPAFPFIERLAGISNAMVAEAPTFVEMADEGVAASAGAGLSHNARFDYGFLKNEFKERNFRATVV